MATASWNGEVIARSDDIVVVEDNLYFPADSVRSECLRPSHTTSTCPWKGEAHYYDVVVNGKVNADAAWYYPSPKKAAENIRGRIAFWHGVEVQQ